MNRGLSILVLALALCACASHHRTAEPPLDNFVEAHPEAEPPRPLQIVEIPHPIPMPNQLKPLPELSPPVPAIPAKESIHQANEAARMEPTPSGFINAMQVWPFSPAALYQVYTMPGKITDIALEPGEDILDVSAPDPVRWIIGDTKSGSGPEERRHVVVKPTRAELQCNLAIFTSRRTYHLELRSTSETWMAAVSWEYPSENLVALQKTNRQSEDAAALATGVSIDNLQFRYQITGDSPSWRPLRAFDDRAKVYIQFPSGIGQGELPPLFVMGVGGDAELVNYRVRAPYYIVDRLFAVAELRIGGKKAPVVRIIRTDVPGSTGARPGGRGKQGGPP
jgi:type IV secretion system protein TrbG